MKLLFSTSVAVLMLVSVARYAQADVPQTINYQGRLTDLSGNPLPDADNYSLVFGIYDVSSGGSALWSELHNTVSVRNGYFNVELGASTPFDSGPTPVNFENTYYLEVQVSPDGPMSPRQKINSVPSAISAHNCRNATHAANAYTLEGIPANGFLMNNTQAVENNDLADNAVTQNKASFAPAVWQHPWISNVQFPKVIYGTLTSSVTGDFSIDLSQYSLTEGMQVMVMPKNGFFFVDISSESATQVIGSTYRYVVTGTAISSQKQGNVDIRWVVIAK